MLLDTNFKPCAFPPPPETRLLLDEAQSWSLDTSPEGSASGTGAAAFWAPLTLTRCLLASLMVPGMFGAAWSCVVTNQGASREAGTLAPVPTG